MLAAAYGSKAGGRDFENYERLCAVANRLIEVDDTVISGTAKGADTLGERYAKEHEPFGMRIERMPAEWEKYGKGAGFRRNHRMAQEGDALLAFWDGKSKGTKNMIEEAHKARLETHVYYY